MKLRRLREQSAAPLVRSLVTPAKSAKGRTFYVIFLFLLHDLASVAVNLSELRDPPPRGFTRAGAPQL